MDKCCPDVDHDDEDGDNVDDDFDDNGVENNDDVNGKRFSS